MTLKQAINKICDILEHPEYPQINGFLAKYGDKHEIIGKCALGEISCKVGLKLEYEHTNPEYDVILEHTGVPKWLISGRNLPLMTRYGKELKMYDINYNNGYNLATYIYNLNDAGFTYPQIVDFLRCTFL